MLHVACWTLFFASVVLVIYAYHLRRLLVKTRATARYNRHLTQFSQFLATLDGADNTKFFQRIVGAAAGQLRANGACFYVYENAQFHVAAVSGTYPLQIASVLDAMNARAAGYFDTLLAGHAQILNTVAAPTDNNLELAVRSILLTPLRLGQEPLGCIVYLNPTQALSFNEDDLAAAQAFGDTIATQLHQRRATDEHIRQQQLDSTLSLAQNVQQLVLPRCNAWPKNLEHTILYKNAQHIGGDFYFCKQLEDDLVALAIADVAGKGIPAALMMASVYTHLRHCAQASHTPSQVLCALNELLLAELHENNFTTMTYATLNLKTKVLRFARAGHTPVVIVSDGTVTTHLPHGAALGLCKQTDFDPYLQAVELQLKTGDFVVLFTDGLTEATNVNGENFGLPRLLDCLHQSQTSAAALQQKIAEEVARYTEDARDQDDLTLLILKI